MSYAGSNLKLILAALTLEMSTSGRPIANETGIAADANNSREDRVVWVPRQNQPLLERPHEQPTDADGKALGKAIAQKKIVVDGIIYGKDFEAAQELDRRVLAGLYNAFSEGAADPFSVPPGELGEGGPREGGAWSIVRPVAFLIPVYLETCRTVPGAPLSSTGSVTDPQGKNPEPIQ